MFPHAICKALRVETAKNEQVIVPLADTIVGGPFLLKISRFQTAVCWVLDIYHYMGSCAVI